MGWTSWSEEPYPTIKEACRSDDVQLLSRTLSAHGVPTRSQDRDHVLLLRFACRECFQHNSLSTLTYILSECRFSTDNITCRDVAHTKGLSTRILDVLLAYGWNINKRSEEISLPTEPLLWKVLDNEDLVKYCLSHGASVHPEGQSPLRPDFITKDQWRCPPVLEKAAAEATVATFDLLRAHGAPLGWRSLHHAVHAATFPWMSGRPDALASGVSVVGEVEGKQYPKAQTYAERMAMVRHLVEDLGLDVNGPDQPPNQEHLPMRHNGPPLCYVAGSDVIEYGIGSETREVLDTRELTWYLLDHDADPRPAFLEAKASGHPTFVADVEAWRAEKRNQSHEKSQAQEKNKAREKDQAQETTQTSKCCCQ